MVLEDKYFIIRKRESYKDLLRGETIPVPPARRTQANPASGRTYVRERCHHPLPFHGSDRMRIPPSPDSGRSLASRFGDPSRDGILTTQI